MSATPGKRANEHASIEYEDFAIKIRILASLAIVHEHDVIGCFTDMNRRDMKNELLEIDPKYIEV